MTMKLAQNEDRNPQAREQVISHLVHRYNEDPGISGRRHSFKNSAKLFKGGLTLEQIAEKQRKLFEHVNMDEDSNGDIELIDEELQEPEPVIEQEGAQPDPDYWETYKQNWLQHNHITLTHEYDSWVAYNVELNV